MAAGYQNNTVEEIKNRCNIVDVIGRVVTLKKAGSNYKGLCPFHQEKTPSFIVSESRQRYTCFGCGETGDVIAFVEKYYNLDFRGAVEMLAKEYGVEIADSFGGGRKKTELYEINRLAARFFYRLLREKANPGYTYMKNRGISEETMNKFGLGYADGQWQSLLNHLDAEGVNRRKMLELGLISRSGDRYFDKFRNRVIFPIINTSGRVIGFGGRIIGEGNPKYLNSPETPVFQKKNNLYGLNLTRQEVSKEDWIILVEGYMDVIALYQAGIRNVAASLGTALTENQAALIKRYTRNVVLSYDADEAGQNAAMRGIDILYQEDLKPRVLKVSDGKDPDEFIQSHGRQAFLDLVDQALPYGDFKIQRIRAGYDLTDEQQRLDYLREVMRALRPMKPMEADLYLQKLAEETGISPQAVRMEFRSADAPVPAAACVRLAAGQPGMTREEKTLLRLMMLRSSFIPIPEDIRRLVFQDDVGVELYRILRESADRPHPLTAGMLRETAEPEVFEALQEIEEIVIPEEKEEQAYRECVAFVRRKELERRDQEITWQLSLADETVADDELAALMREQAEIQRKLKGQG